ncbi:MAG: hypothetical protein K6C40_04995 [Thermoguttaceae bacterium]|nr:hypothetical protein [Thermoguttaceae bacterium]
MYLIRIEITLPEITSYMASHVLSDFYENMRLDKVGLDTDFTNGVGNQPLIFTYSLPGRVEDYDMHPEEHAFPMIASRHPDFIPENAQFCQGVPLWSWDSEKIVINIQPKELDCEPTGEIVDTEDAYVSISRRQVFISFDMIQEFLTLQLAGLGLNLKEVEPITWDVSRNAFICKSGPVSITWVISEPDAFAPLLHFLRLDKMIQSISGEYRFSIEEAAPTSEPSNAMKIPLRKKGETKYW